MDIGISFVLCYHWTCVTCAKISYSVSSAQLYSPKKRCFILDRPIVLVGFQVQVLDERLKEKLVTEFTHLRNNALEPLATFLDYIT